MKQSANGYTHHSPKDSSIAIVYTHSSSDLRIYVYTYLCIRMYFWRNSIETTRHWDTECHLSSDLHIYVYTYGVATISRLLKIIGLYCRKSSLL